MSMYTCQIACERGDVKIGWEDANDAEIREIVEKKLAEGYHFFRESTHDPDTHIRIRRVGDVGNHLIIPDREFHELFTQGKIGVVQAETFDTAQSAGPERVRTATAIMEGQTVAHRAHVSG
jgi:hypothetical protein